MNEISSATVFKGDKSPIAILADDNAKLAASMATVSAYLALVEKLAAGLSSIHAEAKGLQASVSPGAAGTSFSDQTKVNNLHREAFKLLKSEQAATKALSDAKAALAKAEAAEQKAVRDNEKAYERLIAQKQKREAQETVAAAKREAQYNKEIAQVAKSDTLYQRIQQKLNKLIASYQTLAAKKQLGIQLTEKEIRQAEFLERRIGKYDDVLKKVDAGTGKFTRSVGQYGKAFDGLSFSFQQLVREAPSLANSFQTFAMAISNNIPMFTDEVRKVISVNKELTAMGKPTVSAFKQVAASLFSVTGMIGIAVTAFTLLAPMIADWITGSDEASAASKRAAEAEKYKNEQIKKATEFVGQESKEYVGLILQLKHTNAGSKERATLMAEINEKYGVTLKNIKDEALFQMQLNNEVLKYIEYQRNRFQLEKNADLIQRNLTNQDKLRIETAKKLGISVKLLDTFADQTRKSMEAAAGSTQLLIKSQEEINNEKFNPTITDKLKDYVSEVDALNKRLESYGYNSLIANELIAASGYEIEETGKKTEKATTQIDMFGDALERALGLLNDEKKLIQEIRELSQDQRLIDLQLFSEEELASQKKAALDTGYFVTDKLKKLREEEAKSREDFTKQRAEAEVQALKDQMSTEYIVQLEALKTKRDELLSQENATALDRYKIYVDFDRNLKILNQNFSDATTEQQRVQALAILRVYTQLSNDLKALNKETAETIKTDTDTLNSASLEGRLHEVESYYKKESTILYNSKKTKEEIAKEERINQIAQLEEEIFILGQYGDEYKDEVESKELELAKLRREEREKDLQDAAKYWKRITDFAKKATNELLALLERRSKAREEQIDKELGLSKDYENQIIAESNAGIDSDKESLAAQKAVTNEKVNLKRKEQQEQEVLAKIKAGYEIFEQLISKGDSVPVAGAKTVTGLSFIDRLLKAFSGVKSYFVGADDIGTADKPLDGNGGRVIIAHNNEQIMSVKDRKAASRFNPAAGLKSRQDLIEASQFYDLFRVNNLMMGADYNQVRTVPVVDHATRAQLRKLDIIASKLDELPKELFSTEIAGGILRAFHEQRHGNEVKRTYYKT